ncbi:MAG: stage II sporulation protein M [Thermoguttaceae bacterium]|jgi:uncharacterized membrane protein SpoIIM required for sporulation
MKVADLLESRRTSWAELEQLCGKLEKLSRRAITGPAVARFAARYRAACADLALADAYHLPPETVHYLHQLVARAHNQLYRSRPFDVRAWFQEMFFVVPQRLFADKCLRLAFSIFWGIFLLAAIMARNSSEFAERVVSKTQLTFIEEQFSSPISHRDPDAANFMSGFYIWNNAGIGLRCFAFGLLFGVGGLFATIYNAAMLGAVFGNMTTVAHPEHFFHFVTAHGPFELTGIVLSAAAGMRMGFSLVDTGGRTRSDALRRSAQQSVPIMAAATVLFLLAAGIEAFLSPTAAPYWIKAGVAIASTVMLLFYFFVLGFPRGK